MEKKSITIILFAVIIVFLLLGVALGVMIYKDRNILWKNQEVSKDESKTVNVVEPESNIEPPKETKKEAGIYNGTDRPIAVMIDNHKGAWPQAGLNEAYLVYEIIAEGGETRLMALFKGKKLDIIGPVRSSRHYFLDYVMENDAIYVHYGWSPKAKGDISTWDINNLNGIYLDKTTFWRISKKKAPHNAMTSTEKILQTAEKQGYRTTSELESLLTYSTDEIELPGELLATEVHIKHSYLHNVTYKYDETTKRYIRYARGVIQKDYSTGENITTKNIIIEFVDNSVLQDGTDKDRQEIYNIGTHNGYYITNGKAIKITCTKNSRNTRTMYKDLEGNTIEVNDGNTWINFCPNDADFAIK